MWLLGGGLLQFLGPRGRPARSFGRPFGPFGCPMASLAAFRPFGILVGLFDYSMGPIWSHDDVIFEYQKAPWPPAVSFPNCSAVSFLAKRRAF